MYLYNAVTYAKGSFDKCLLIYCHVSQIKVKHLWPEREGSQTSESQRGLGNVALCFCICPNTKDGHCRQL